MSDLKELIGLGLRCPNCNSNALRVSDRDPQNLESFICEECGYRWLEDVYPDDDGGWGVGCAYWVAQIKTKLRSKRFEERLIWVLHSANQPERVRR